MKIRNGFVSNSSSSSFVVTDTKGGYEKLKPIKDLTYDVGASGETEFGWGISDVKDIHSRINFAYLQTLYADNDEWEQMLDDVIRENSVIEEINYLISKDYDAKGKVWGYIDHQSSAVEGMNIEIFESKDTLKDFIFGKGSSIHLDNDNH